MIGLRDAFTIARAKMRTRRVVLALSVAVSALLFGVLVAMVLVFAGLAEGVQRYGDTVQNGRYFVSVSPNIPSDVMAIDQYQLNDELIAELNKLQRQYVAEQKEYARQNNQPFDENLLPKILTTNPFSDKTLSTNDRLMISMESPVYAQYMNQRAQRYILTAKNKVSDLQSKIAKYGNTRLVEKDGVGTTSQNTTLVLDGKEDLKKLAPQNMTYDINSLYKSDVRQSTYMVIDDAVIQRFIMYDKSRDGELKGIPVVMTADEAWQLFGEKMSLPKKPINDNSELAWYNTMREKTKNVTYQVCYRNPAEMYFFNKAKEQAVAAEENKNNREFVRPSVEYSLPTGTCEPVKITRDVRTVDDKKRDLRELTQSGITDPVPARHLMTFQVVGLVHNGTSGNGSMLESIMYTVFRTDFGSGAMIPKTLADQFPQSVTLFGIKKQQLQASSAYHLNDTILLDAGIKSSVVEFRDLQNAIKFLKDESCNEMFTCTKPFRVSPLGVNYAGIEELKNMFGAAVSGFLPVVVGVAAIILALTIGRVLSDSRRETAVFRALGAKRRDIVMVYLLYALRIMVRVVIFALLLGLILAVVMDVSNSADITARAKIAYGVFETIAPIHLLGVNVLVLGGLIGVMIVVGVAASIPAILANIRRNPIDDLRSE